MGTERLSLQESRSASGSPARRLRIGVVGCAGIAWRRMLPALTANPDVTLAAVASRDADKARVFTDRFGGEPVAGYDRLLARDDLDAVYVPLPALLHAEWIERALLAGKHVLSEKPLAATYGEAAALVALAEARGLVLLESFMFLCHPQHARVRELVAEGVIGELRTLTAEFAFPSKGYGDIRWRPDIGGGALTDIGVYPVRTALLHLGPEVEVVGAALDVDRERAVDTAGAALVTGPGGVTGQLSWGMRHAYRSQYALWGSAGRISVQWAYTPPPTHQPVIRIEQQSRVEELTLPAEDQFARVVAAFVARIRHGEPSGLEGESVLRQAQLVDRVRELALLLPDGRPRERMGSV
ncbi:Gfo/Idh/MocA family protein [Actinacidiphila paucisporea]|uniref:NDP-hexose-3-ketoreductase n=1 Tax=Actinacidiphila paucisporea TaxID=310782 RepID=A0A1M7QES1_9ACTN|nr:Gfo/Idh/MocA family oxidoreductase [Actinacidiphila paucisporea]SHN29416.1 NDP-hexose-3-ketoreductase [Actinacidiphila paucisporea]